MKNIIFKIENNKLKLEVDLTKNFGKSKSGKSVIVASTEGNLALGKDDLKMGFNLYKPE